MGPILGRESDGNKIVTLFTEFDSIWMLDWHWDNWIADSLRDGSFLKANFVSPYRWYGYEQLDESDCSYSC